MSLFDLRPDSEPQKKALIQLHVSMLAGLLHLPEGVETTTAHYDPKSEHLLVQVVGEGLPDGARHFPGQSLPLIKPMLRMVKAVTFDDKPHEVDHIEFDGWA